MKAVLSNRILLSYSDELYEKLKKELTYYIPPMSRRDPGYNISTLKRVGRRAISIPSGRVDLIPSNYEIIDKRTDIPVTFPRFAAQLRPSQEKIYNEVDSSCLINANPSWGKTFTSLAIAGKLSQRTLVIVHNIGLRDQWVKEIKKVYGITAGVIGSGEFTLHPIITVANIQTLKKHAAALADKFGTVILDECHHTPAKTFQETLNLFKAKYKLGLSATLIRKDNLHKILPDYFGTTIHYTPQENQLVPKVLLVQTPIVLSSNPHVAWGIKINDLCNNPNYFKIITDLAEAYSKAGHKVLVVCPRVEFIKDCINKHTSIAYGVYGDIPLEEREAIQKELEHHPEKNILYGTASIYTEGISLNYLSCLILATPINNTPVLKQLVGRVTREHPNKKDPVIVDVVLSGATAKNQAKTRTAFYIDNEYNIELVDLT
jgi:superfamily II DNA or RNA helicase